MVRVTLCVYHAAHVSCVLLYNQKRAGSRHGAEGPN